MGNMEPKGGTLVAPGKASRPHLVRGVDCIFRGVDSIFRGVDYLPYIGGVLAKNSFHTIIEDDIIRHWMKRAYATSAKFECKQSLKTVPRGQSKFCRAVLVAHGITRAGGDITCAGGHITRAGGNITRAGGNITRAGGNIATALAVMWRSCGEPLC